jgi:phage terminase large subunit
MMTEKRISFAQTIGKGYNQFHHSKNFYRVVKGSRGSKKSKTTALDYIYKLLKYPWANLLVVRRFSNTNKQSTFTDLQWACHRLGVADKFKFNQSIPEITVKATGQKIIFRGLDKELSVTSITVEKGILCWCWVEEAYQIENQAKFDTLTESIRGGYEDPNFYKQITVTFNPWSEHHWLKSAFFDEETRYNNVFSDTTTYKDNEWLDEQDISRYEDLYIKNPRRAQVVCDGNWGVTEGLVFENFHVQDFDTDEKAKEIELSVHGMDFGFTNDPTTITSAFYDEGKKEIWLYDELYKTGLLSSDIVAEVEKRNLMKAEIIADGATQLTIAELNNKGIRRIRGSKKGKDSVQRGIDFLQGLKIYIHPSCVKTIEEFNTYCYKQDLSGKWLNTPEDRNNHIIDALRYALEPYSMKKKGKWSF